MNIIFDTNASRKYVENILIDNIDEYAKIKAKEFDDKHIKLLLTPIVLMELQYHLVDIKDRDYSISFKTIKALLLTNKFQTLTNNDCYLAAPEILIARDLFGLTIPGREDMYSSIMHSSRLISEESNSYIPKLSLINGGTIKDYIDNIENGFAIQINGFLSQTLENCSDLKQETISKFIQSKHTDFALTLYIVRTTYNLLIQENQLPKNYLNIAHPNDPNIQKIKKQCEFIATRSPSFLSLFKELITRFFQSKKQLTSKKMKNYIWDILLMFNVNNLTIQKEKVLFITDDKAMLLTAKTNDEYSNILTYDEFKNSYLI